MGKECTKRASRTPNGRETVLRKNKSPLGLERLKRYRHTDKYRKAARERMKRNYWRAQNET